MVKKSNTKKKQDDTPKKICSKCSKEQKILDFYNCNNINFSDGKSPICKSCIQEIIDIDNLETVYEILKLMDSPFDFYYWKKALEKKSVFGTYMRFINSLPQLKGKSWKDSIFPKDSEVEELSNIVDSREDENQSGNRKLKNTGDKFIEEKKVYSKKWLGHYTPTEIDHLENYLSGLHNDFKITNENHKDYAKKIAKASLHMDNCFQDMLDGKTGADKRYKDAKDIFDTLSRSAQFAESGRGQNDVGLGSFGKIVNKVEQKKWVPQHIPLEKDDIDKILDQYNHIEKSV